MAELPHLYFLDERTTTRTTYFGDHRHDGADACDEYDYGAGDGREDVHAHWKGRGSPAVDHADHAERASGFALASGSVAQGGEPGDGDDEVGDECGELDDANDDRDDGDGRGLLGCGWD